VLGRGAPLWQELCRLARPRVTPLFGGGRATVQPVAVEDVVECLLAWLREGGLARETIDVGGPEILSFRDLLARVRRALRGSDAGMIRVPWRASQAVLGLLEPLFLERLPWTAGQLYAFRYDGTALPSDFMVRRRDRLQRLDPLIQRLARE
jgi:NADH dehydrogenase